MKAAVHTRYGPPEVVRIAEVEQHGITYAGRGAHVVVSTWTDAGRRSPSETTDRASPLPRARTC